MSHCTTPKVANHHRRALLSVANHLKRYSGAILSVPFADVPPLPTKPKPREPIPAERIGSYIDALPPHVRRPALMILLFGLRLISVCNLSIDSQDGNHLRALDKGRVHRLIPIDETLADIIAQAKAWRSEIGAQTKALFVNETEREWNHDRLLRAAQNAWKKAGLGRKVMHEIRHTLGTLASKSFPARMVQAVMGHQSEQSSLAYGHPDEDMAAEVRQKIITNLSQDFSQNSIMSVTTSQIGTDKDGIFICPNCSAKLCISRDKIATQPLKKT